jgi:acetyltransferase-like isoleucine patch superfamily enzyme
LSPWGATFVSTCETRSRPRHGFPAIVSSSSVAGAWSPACYCKVRHSAGPRQSKPIRPLCAGVKLAKFINLYGCTIGDETRIGAFGEFQKNATVGRRCKISSHTFICEGVTIEDHVFIGHSVTFINDPDPRATTASGDLQTEQDWSVEPTLVKLGASIGSGSTILSNVTISEGAIVGAGSVVTHDVPAGTIVAGNPARVLRPVPPDWSTNE